MMLIHLQKAVLPFVVVYKNGNLGDQWWYGIILWEYKVVHCATCSMTYEFYECIFPPVSGYRDVDSNARELKQLKPEELFYATIAKLRKEVFVDEQKVDLANEIDEQDQKSVHILAMKQNSSVGTARLFKTGDTVCTIGRVAVKHSERGKGLGKELMKRVEQLGRIHFPEMTKIEVHAQQDKQAFYSSLGYILDASIPVWIEENIPHVMMVKTVEGP
jgi:predicted GNAT family N-acyltransferase